MVVKHLVYGLVGLPQCQRQGCRTSSWLDGSCCSAARIKMRLLSGMGRGWALRWRAREQERPTARAVTHFEAAALFRKVIEPHPPPHPALPLACLSNDTWSTLDRTVHAQGGPAWLRGQPLLSVRGLVPGPGIVLLGRR